MLATVAVTVATHDLSAGVAVGVLLSGAFFAFKVTRGCASRSATIRRPTRASTSCRGRSSSPAPRSSPIASIFAARRRARIDLTSAHLWDITAVAALEEVASTMRRHGMVAEPVGLNEASVTLMDRHAR